ncbi:hypothetical protein JCM3765_005653 [Sporobolomyces pararoseus]
MSPSPPACFCSLPPEIILRIIRYFLDPQSITRLATTCTILHDLARSEIVWKEIVLRLVDQHGVDSNFFASSNHHQFESSKKGSTTWWQQARWLLPNARHLGYFLSSIPFSSRIMRVAIVNPSSPDKSSPSSPPNYSIHAAQLRPFNLFSVNSPPPLHILPFGASLEITLDAYNISRLRNPLHFDAGISTDVLEPRYDFTAGMIDITMDDGAVLCQSGSAPGEADRQAGSQSQPQPRSYRLRLSLEVISQLVHGTGTGSKTSPTNSDSAAESNTSPELSREALLALFSGRLPRRSWPTLELVGLYHQSQEVENSASDQGETRRRIRTPRTRLSTNGRGAFRGVQEWVSERGISQSLARIIKKDTTEVLEEDQEKEEAYVTGFKFRAKRRGFSSTLQPLPTPPATIHDRPAHSFVERRRGVGRDGGMAVLWDGAEEDPDLDIRPVTILRAGDQDQGGVVLHLRDDSNARRQNQAPTPLPDTSRDTGTPQPDSAAEALDSAAEAFFPIKPPSKPISWEFDKTWVEEGQDITAASLEGMWIGTYGSHGLEFVHLSASPTSSPDDTSITSLLSRPPTPCSYDAPEDTYFSTTESSPPGRILTATKLTGDTNVPSGETTWIAFLDEPTDSSPAASSSKNHRDLSAEADSVPSISSEKWTSMNQLDPSSAEGRARGRFSSQDWLEGTTKGVGQIALSGFLQPGWTEARVRFIRSKISLFRNRQTGEVSRVDSIAEGLRGGEEKVEDWDRKTVESVEEIQLRWSEMNKIAVFKRVRI